MWRCMHINFLEKDMATVLMLGYYVKGKFKWMWYIFEFLLCVYVWVYMYTVHCKLFEWKILQFLWMGDNYECFPVKYLVWSPQTTIQCNTWYGYESLLYFLCQPAIRLTVRCMGPVFSHK